EKEGKLMKGSEIVSLSKQVSFDYFVQGAIGNTDDGRVLSRKESSFLILDLFDKTGNKVGGIRFASEDKIMADINLIKDACLKIAGLFGKENQPKPNRFFIF
ncbi:MAG: lipoprotein, partial [Leptospira sp.]|nr:lipoprotein [Leptospira sp.]